MVRRLFLLLSALALAGCGGGSHTGFKTFHLPYHGGTIHLPADWRFRNGGSIGDHSTWFWYDPRDAFAKLRVVGSGCVGCVSKNLDYTTPNPQGELPPYATVTAAPDPYTLAYQVFDSPYTDDGMVIVMHKGAAITGSLIFDLWLPRRAHADAAQILASFRPSGA